MAYSVGASLVTALITVVLVIIIDLILAKLSHGDLYSRYHGLLAVLTFFMSMALSGPVAMVLAMVLEF